MGDALGGGRRLRIRNIINDYTRESLVAWCDYSMPGEKVVEVLKSILNDRGRPEQIGVDNGPEFRGRVFVEWCQVEGIVVKYIQVSRCRPPMLSD